MLTDFLYPRFMDIRLSDKYRAIVVLVVFFLLFLFNITFTNYLSSQRATLNFLNKRKENLLLQQKSLQEDVYKQVREVVNQDNKGYIKVSGSNLVKPQDILKKTEEPPKTNLDTVTDEVMVANR
jgi:hypothetical protein